MTVGENPGFVSDDIAERLQAWETRPIMPVHVVSQSGKWGKKLPPEFVGLNTWPVPQSIASGGSGQGYVQIAQRRYARSRMRIWIPSISGTGQVEIPENSPAAGQPFVWTNNTGSNVLVTALRGFLTTDAVVANRFITIQLKDAGNNIMAAAQNTLAVVASSTISINSYIGASQTNSASGYTSLPLPSALYIPPGGTVALSIANMDAGDQLSQIVLTYETTGNATVRIASDIPTLQNGGGIAIPSGLIPFGGGGGWSWESQRPCYATCDNTTATILTADESFADEPGDG